MVKNNSFRNQQKIKDDQISFLLVDLEKSLEDYSQALEIKENQLSEAKRLLVSAKKSFDKISQENRDLKTYIENLKRHYQRESQKQQLDFLKQQTKTPTKPKKYKKVIFEEEVESENEPEFEEEDETENEKIEQEPQIKKAKRKNKSNIFDYINKNAKRHEQ